MLIVVVHDVVVDVELVAVFAIVVVVNWKFPRTPHFRFGLLVGRVGWCICHK